MAILCDLNGTIAQPDGKPIQKTIDFLKNCSEDIYVISGSTEAKRKQYEHLLLSLEIPYVELILSQEDQQSDLGYKLRMSQTIDNLTLAIDNNKKVVAMYKDIGINAIFPEDIDITKLPFYSPKVIGAS
jgi:hypothetical protein